MKNLNLCIGLFLGLIILSCSSEDDEILNESYVNNTQ